MNHLPILHRWDEWLNMVGRGEEQAARRFWKARGTVNLVNFPSVKIQQMTTLKRRTTRRKSTFRTAAGPKFMGQKSG